MNGLVEKIKSHRLVVADCLLLALLAAALIFPNLGGEALWCDEGDTAFYALTIKQHGLPLGWDGRNFNYVDRYAFDRNLVMLTVPWVSLYAAAGSVMLFGETDWAVRFPFALAGVLTVPVLYLLVRRMTGSRAAALTSAVLLLLSVQFLLFSRAARYYSFIMLLTMLALLFFTGLERTRNRFFFSAAAVLLFYSLTLPALCLLAALGLVTSVYRPFFRLRRGFWYSVPAIALVTLPWIVFTGWRWMTSQDVRSDGVLAELLLRAGQLSVEMLTVVPLIGWLALLPFAWRRIPAAWHGLIVLCGTTGAALAAAAFLMHTPGQMSMFGTRHYCSIIPLGAALTGVLITAVSSGVSWLRAALIALLGATHLGGNFLPWLHVYSAPDSPARDFQMIIRHAPRHPLNLVLRGELAGYVLGLFMENPGAVQDTVRILREQGAGPDDLALITYESESVYFYTRIPTTGRINQGDPVYDYARAHNLPEYVFDALAADWIVWRTNGGNHVLPPELFQQMVRALQARGRTVREVGRFRDTTWENRNNLHFHRFPVLGYLYLPDPKFEAVVLKVTGGVPAQHPDSPVALNNRAWLLATSADDAARNGAEAVRLAERACELSGGGHPGLLDTLAAAYAEAGRFEEAQATAQRAAELARSAGDEEQARAIEAHLDLYRQGLPLRQ